MKIFPAILSAAVGIVSPLAQGAVNFFEGFESPVIPGPAQFEAVESGTQSFDNPGWVVVNSADPDGPGGTPPGFGVYLTTLPNLQVTGQALALGGSNTSGSSLSIVISGFASMELPSIKFDYREDLNGVQTTLVEVTDPENGDNLLWSTTIGGDGSVDEDFAEAPSGDTVKVTFTQTGTSNNSDASIDNLEITAVPEPSLALLGALGVLIGLFRRRR